MVAAAPAAHAEDVTIGADTVGGSYYLYAGGLASYLTEKNPTVQGTARTTRGSVENVRLLDRDGLDFGLANASVVGQQQVGYGQFKDAKSDKIRGIAVLDLSPTHVVTLANSGIKTLMDLKGKRVSIGAAGSGGANTARTVLTALGIINDVKIQTLGFSESANNLRDGNLDAFFGGSGLPMPAVVDLATGHDIRLLTFDDAFLAKLQSEVPAIEITTIPGKTYRGVEYDVKTIGIPSTLVTRANMNDEAAYQVAKTLLSPDNKKYMQSIYKAWDPNPGFDLWKRIHVPLHPGAEKAYREAGLLK
jgi:hypothetical protein